MSHRHLIHVQSVRFFILILSVAALVCGCRSLPDVQLGRCENLNYDKFSENFQFDIPDVLRYRYTFRWKNKELICSGITAESSDGGVNIAGFIDSGLTMYSAKWQNGQLEVLRNNMKMPEVFLKRSILSDLLLLYRRLPAEGNCIRRNIDGSKWLKTNNSWMGSSGCFVLIDNQPGWGGLRKGKIYFMALASTGDNNIPADITIENYKEGYRAQIRYSKGDSE